MRLKINKTIKKEPLDKLSVTEKLKLFADKNPVIVLVSITAFIVSSLLSIAQGVEWIAKEYDEKYLWRISEYKKIDQITAGMNIEKAKEIFGSPELVDSVEKNLTEAIFIERDYYIQTIINKNNTIIFLAITACDPLFNPEVESPYSTSYSGDIPMGPKKIILGKTKFDLITLKPLELKYSISGATAPSYLFDKYSRDNMSRYQTMYLGWNDSCPIPEDESLSDLYDHQNKGLDDPVISKFRSNTPINTFGVTSATITLEEEELLDKSIMIGPDRIKLRTLSSYINR